MCLVLLVVMDRRHVGHGGAIEANRGHGGVEVSQTDAEAQEGEE